MVRDSRLYARNSMVIPGGLLLFYSLVLMIVYAGFRTSDTTLCGDYSRIMLGGTCYSVYVVFGIPLIIGLVLTMLGLMLFKGTPETPEAYLYHGTGSHFLLSLIISLIVLPLMAAAGQYWQDLRRGVASVIFLSGYEIRIGDVLLLVSVIGIFMFIPYMFLYLRQAAMLRRYLRSQGRL